MNEFNGNDLSSEEKMEKRLKKACVLNVIFIIIIVILLWFIFMFPKFLGDVKLLLPERWVNAIESNFECVCPSCEGDENKNDDKTGSSGISGSTTIEGEALGMSFDADSLMVDSNENYNADMVQINKNGGNISFKVDLKVPNDYVTFYVTLVNNGEHDVEIVGKEMNVLTSYQAQYLEYRFTYANGKTINARKKSGTVETAGDIIKKGQSVKLKITVRYRDDFKENLKEDLVDIPFNSKLIFAQAD